MDQPPARPGIMTEDEARRIPGATDGLVFQSRRQAEALEAWAAAHPALPPPDEAQVAVAPPHN